MRQIFKKFLILLFFFFFGLSFFGAGYLTAQKGISTIFSWPSSSLNSTDSTSSELDLTLFWTVLGNLQGKYFDSSKLSSTSLLYGAIRGMVSSLGDPYTSFFDPAQNSGFKNELSGYYEGIGAQLGFKTITADSQESQLVVISPLGNSPAQKAGIKAGDLILKIGDRSTNGLGLAEAIAALRGKEGTEVKITLARGLSSAKVFEVTIKRAKIKVDSVNLDWKEGRMAEIKISRFGDDTDDLWDKTAQEINDKCRGVSCNIILDLRNNPGGLLESASFILSDFFQDGTVVIREYPNGTKDKTTINRSGRLLKEKVVVLINGGSASSAEIVAGALQDRKRAVLVGEKSFGKGTIQEAVELDGGAALHITSSKWLLPSGRWINGQGLIPDYPVDLSDEDFKMGKDPQLDKAIELFTMNK